MLHWNLGVQVSLTIDDKAVADALKNVAPRQLPFVTALGITKVGQAVQKHFKDQLPKVFDRPTDFTVRGVFLETATKSRPVATVFFPDSAENRGRDQREYIRPGAQGTSARSQKKTENLLTRMGVLPAGWITVPGSFFKNGRLDQYGNISGAYYKQIISGLRLKNTKGQAKPVSAASQRRADKMGVDAEFFAVSTGTNKLGKNGGWLPSGVYRRTGPGGRKLQQYLIFVRRASYKARFDVQKQAQTAINASANAAFAEALNELSTKFAAR